MPAAGHLLDPLPARGSSMPVARREAATTPGPSTPTAGRLLAQRRSRRPPPRLRTPHQGGAQARAAAKRMLTGGGGVYGCRGGKGGRRDGVGGAARSHVFVAPSPSNCSRERESGGFIHLPKPEPQRGTHLEGLPQKPVLKPLLEPCQTGPSSESRPEPHHPSAFWLPDECGNS
ncbi:hypothetical protein PVAP13_2KG390400 [Panicum virgatum]|uniref:Uncharacterized protein n=1 Tax=Panicum virgatum TaxID=38727 RepID=A0A8T0WFM3_PANVG|nr:hypothetical protein PVAP13_2KG390400 [Panicum virgatum]